jgi:hypothetical protein
VYKGVRGSYFVNISSSNSLVHDLSLFWFGTDNITTSNTLVHDLSLFWLGTDNIATSNTLVHDLSLFWLGTDTTCIRVLEVDMLSVLS